MPSLKSKLDITGSNNAVFTSLTSKDLIDCAIKTMRVFETEADNYIPVGAGTIEEPYVLNSPLSFLYMSLQLATMQSDDNSIFLKIGGRIIKLNTKNRYVTDWSDDVNPVTDETLRFIFAQNNLSLLPREVHEDRIKISYALKYLPADSLRAILTSPRTNHEPNEYIRSRLNKIINFIYKVELLCLASETKTKVSIKNNAVIAKLDGEQQKIPFPFEALNRNRNLLDNFFDTLGHALPFKSLFLFIKGGDKGPSYPILDYLFNGFLETSKIITARLYGIQENNLLLTLMMVSVLNGDSVSDTYNYPINGQTLSLEGCLHKREWFANVMPLVAGCLFLAEVVRNPVSFLSGIIYLRLIENANAFLLSNRPPKTEPATPIVSEFDRSFWDSKEIQEHYKTNVSFEKYNKANLYGWVQFFSNNNYHVDIYGNLIPPVEWGGIPPMARAGSYIDEFKPEFQTTEEIQNTRWNVNEPLTITRQKEAHQLMDWLEIQFENPQVKAQLDEIQANYSDPDQIKLKVLDFIQILLNDSIRTFGSKPAVVHANIPATLVGPVP